MSSTAKLSAKERIYTLLDDNSFVEIGALVTKRSTDFNLQQVETPGDGVVTGYGVIDGSPVYVYSQDAASLHGTMGEMHAKKITNLYQLAMKTGAPVIGLVDCAGLRLQEATDALEAFGQVYRCQAMASGIVPQITAVLGTCGGGMAVLASMSDFVFMEEKNGKLFVNTPNAIEGNNVNKCDTAAASFMAEGGSVDFVYPDEVALLNGIRELVAVLPANNEAEAADELCSDDLNRTLPAFSAEIEDCTQAIRDLSDNGLFVETKAAYAKEMVTGFIKLNGATVGVIANRSQIQDEKGKAVAKFDSVLTTKGCYKAEKMVEFCDAFGIPVLTLTNVTGYSADKGEAKSIATAAAKLTYAFANATVPKINLVTGKAYGSAYITMNSKSVGADLVYAMEGAEIGTMDASLAAQIIYADDAAAGAEKAEEYRALCLNAASAAKRGYVDAIITGEEVRAQLIYAYEMLCTKRESRPSKKHGTI